MITSGIIYETENEQKVMGPYMYESGRIIIRSIKC